jgi:hypothetical protein
MGRTGADGSQADDQDASGDAASFSELSGSDKQKTPPVLAQKRESRKRFAVRAKAVPFQSHSTPEKNLL